MSSLFPKSWMKSANFSHHIECIPDSVQWLNIFRNIFLNFWLFGLFKILNWPCKCILLINRIDVVCFACFFACRSCFVAVSSTQFEFDVYSNNELSHTYNYNARMCLKCHDNFIDMRIIRMCMRLFEYPKHANTTNTNAFLADLSSNNRIYRRKYDTILFHFGE